MFQELVVNDKLKYFRPTDSDDLKIVFMSFCCPMSICHWRSVSPAKSLAKIHGIPTTVIFDHIRKEVVDWADVVVFQRVTGDTAKKLVTYCNLKNITTIYDIDDNFLEYPDTEEYKDINTDDVKNNVLNILNDCDAITTTTPELKNSLKRHLGNKNIYTLPNYLDFEFWSRNIKYHDDEFIRIGYLGGSYHISDLQMILIPLFRILEKYPNVKLEIIGMNTSLNEYFPNRVIYHAPMDFDKLPDFLANNHFDIAIAPLLDNTFSASRSNIRLLQHSLFDTVCILSPIGTYKQSVTDGFSGLIADNNDEDWISKLSYLIENKTERINRAKSGKSWVIKNYNMNSHSIKWLRAYKDIIKKIY